MNSPRIPPTVSLGDLVDILSGFAFKSERFADAGELPIIRIRDVKRGYSETYYSGEYDDRYVVENGDLLIGMDGEFNRERWQGGKALLNQRVCKLSPDNRHLSSEYLYHFLPKVLRDIEDRTPFATVKHLSSKDIKEIEILLPPLAEQRRIAAILDKADALRRKRKRTLGLLDNLTRSIFLEMFGDPIENTKQLPIVTLENVVSPSRKITYGILKPGPDQPGGVPYVRVVDIQNSLIDFAGLKRTTTTIASEYKRSTLRDGDLLISIRGHVGRMAITTQECDGANITQDTARLAITGANTEFVKAQLETDPAKHWMARRTKGAAVKGINLGDLRQFPLILPSRRLQDEFADKMRIVRKMLEKCSRQRDDMDTLFSSLQSRAFSGQL